jgi:hypothetical protein
MVETHMSVQLGLVHKTFSGIKTDMVEMMFCHHPSVHGPWSAKTYSQADPKEHVVYG